MNQLKEQIIERLKDLTKKGHPCNNEESKQIIALTDLLALLMGSND